MYFVANRASSNMLHRFKRFSAPRHVSVRPIGVKKAAIARVSALESLWERQRQQTRSYQTSTLPTPSGPPKAPTLRRRIVTFSSHKIVDVGQEVFDISGHQYPLIFPQGKPAARVRYEHEGSQPLTPFPHDTIGAFYYRQSANFPTRIGELRFRLCLDIRDFAAGNDLLLPSGQPWFISSHSLHTIKSLQPIRDHLIEEGLLERDIYPGIPDSMLARDVNPLTSFKQPFVVDLSAVLTSVSLISPNLEAAPHLLRLKWVFRKVSNWKVVLFSGRAVVCLEPYPNQPDRRPRLMTVRVLEFLTPIKRISPSNDLLDPIPGELVMHRYRGQYIPYGYNPHQGDIREAIKNWIDAQSTPSQSE